MTGDEAPPEPAYPSAHASAESEAPPATASEAPPAAASPAIPLVSTRRLIGASFDLLIRTGEDMRRASFYVGAIVLGTVGPFALASFALEVISLGRGPAVFERVFEATGSALLAGLGTLAVVGLVVATIESRTLGVAVLGGAMAGRPITIRMALARSRRSFWLAILAAVIVAIPVTFAQAAVSEVVNPLFGLAEEASVLTSTLVTAVVGAPFAYVLAGVVLGDVDAFEALKRSIRVFRARKLAAVVVVIFESIAALLILLGIFAGLDVALRVFSALGLGPDSGPVGLALTTVGVVAVIFAFGTLVYTVMAITVAPQVVMFVGLTHAIVGLDRVRPGGVDDPDLVKPRTRPFRWFTRPMVLGFALGALGLAGTIALFSG